MFPLRDINKSHTVPFVNLTFIAINVLVFFFELSLGEEGLENLFRTIGLVPYKFLDDFGPGQIATIFTSMFLHGGWMHLLSNMWALYIFGDNIEDRMGHARYFAFYILCGIAAALTQVFASAGSHIPTVGASGAIAGVLGGYIVLFPGARVLAAIPIFYIIRFVEVPAILYLGFWFASQFFTGVASLGATTEDGSGGVAWWAHIGGFVLGVVLVKIFEKRGGNKGMAEERDSYDRYY